MQIDPRELAEMIREGLLMVELDLSVRFARPWAERLQPVIAWLQAAGYLVERGESVSTPGGPAPQGLFRS